MERGDFFNWSGTETREKLIFTFRRGVNFFLLADVRGPLLVQHLPSGSDGRYLGRRGTGGNGYGINAWGSGKEVRWWKYDDNHRRYGSLRALQELLTKLAHPRGPPIKHQLITHTNVGIPSRCKCASKFRFPLWVIIRPMEIIGPSRDPVEKVRRCP